MPLSAFIATAGLVFAQIVSGLPVFDAVSIKPDSSAGGGRTGGGPPLRFTPGLVVSGSGGATVKTIIQEAYDQRGYGYKLSGGPAWLDFDKFELVARAADSSADPAQLRLMLQSLLAQRFQFIGHRETREIPVYVLTVGKSGPRFRELKDGEDPPIPSGAELTQKATMQGFVDSLNTGAGRIFAGLDRPVADSTGLQGRYFFVVNPWERDDDFKAVAEAQLGLKFERQTKAVDVLVIDHIEKPSGN